MASHIVKAAPDRDVYVLWSTNVDAPEFIGTKAELVEELKGRREYDARRLERADQYGTSARLEGGCRAYGWENEAFIVRELVPEPRVLARANLEAFTLAAVDERVDEMVALTEPLEE